MKKSLKNILMSGAAASAVVGGTYIVVTSQPTAPQTKGSTTENASKPTPKVKEAPSTPSVSSSSTELPSKSDESAKSSQTSSEKKEDEKVGQPKEDASSTSTVPSIQEKQKQEEEVQEESKQETVETISDKVEEKPRTLNPTTTVRRVSEPIEKAEVSKLNQTRKVTVSVPRKETPTAVSSETPRVQTAPQSQPTEVVEQPRVVEQPTTPTVTETPQPSVVETPTVSETPTAPPTVEQPTQPTVVETSQPTRPSVVETPKVVEQPTTPPVVDQPRVVETPQPTQPTQPEVVSEKGQPLVQEENPVGIVSDKGTSLIQDENPVGVVSEKGIPLVQEENSVGVVSEKGAPLVQEENPVGVVFKKGFPLIQEENPVGVVSEKGTPLIQEENPIGAVFEKGQPLVQETKPEYVIFEKGTPLIQEDSPVGLISEKGTSLVQEDNPIYVISEKGEPLVQPENQVGVVSEKGTSLVQDEKPVGVVFEKGEPLVQEELPIYIAPVSTPIAEVKSEKGVPEIRTPLEELVITEKGEPLVQPVKQELTITSKGQPLVQEENPTYVISEKGQPEVREELPLGVFSEKGEPLVESNKPLGIVFEKGEPEVLLGTLPEYKFKIVRREDVTPIATAFLNLGDFRREVGTKAKIVKGYQGNITKVYEDVVAEDGTVLNSTLKSDTTTDPVYHVYRYGTKPVGSHKGEEGLYRLHEHTSEMDIVDFRQDITLTGEEIKALGQDEINRRASDESLENNITLANPKNWSNVTIANAPLSEVAIANFNNGTYINHKNVGLEVLNLVNEERRRVGLNELTWDDELFNLTKERASELGKNGHIRFWNERNEVMTHVRDNKGTKWFTVADNSPFAGNWLGENLAGFTLPRNVYKVFSEKVIALQLYTQWRNSPGHYANMIGEHYRRFAFDMSYSTFWRDDAVNVDYLPQGIQGVQLFSS